MSEEWRPCASLSGYEVSSVGRVRNGVAPKAIHYNGRYLVVIAYFGGVRNVRKVHRLVAGAFIPNPYNKQDVNHKNGIKTDNRVENLEWATRQENIRHAVATGLAKPAFGENHWSAKLRLEQVKEILDLFNGGWSMKELAERYRVSKETIRHIVRGKAWRVALKETANATRPG